ncbi:MAG TPA: carboxypeptidase-like regulatory domain-containing protein, partial [Kofleriaceae bacterium]|nr:carboxypeptidase-like regulatory domain-containing protein [Kofleriaceae bacterium]
MAALVAVVVIAALATIVATRGDEAPVPTTALPSGDVVVPAPAQAVVVPAPVVDVRVTRDGAPVADVVVVISDGSRPERARATTDREGRVRFAGLDRGPFELWAAADGLASAPARIEQPQ